MAGKLFVVVGGQFGSEGKGAVAGRICSDMASAPGGVVCVRVGGPNAGHTVIGKCPPDCGGLLAHLEKDSDGHAVAKHPWRLRQVPVAAVTNPEATLVIAAGSEIDPEVLQDELRLLDSAGYCATDRLMVDRSATLLKPEYIVDEHTDGIQARLGSTAKGIGAARADRIWRTAQTWGDFASDEHADDTSEFLAQMLRDGAAVVVEGTQGYGLGLHTENYPFTTSGDCRAIDFLAQAGVSPWMSRLGQPVELAIVVCLRPYPIRVAGNSGQLKGETDWDTLGLPVEHTTVTQKVRRVGEWDAALARAAIVANGGPRAGVVWVALTMMDSVDPTLTGNDWSQRGWTQRAAPLVVLPFLESIGMGTGHLGYVGTGPDTALVNERMYTA